MFFSQRALRIALASVLAALMAFPSSTFAKTGGKAGKPVPTPPGTTVSGRVLGGDGKTPVRGALIEVRSIEGDKSWKSLPTDRSGRYQVKGLDYGWAEIVITTGKGEFIGDQAINLPPGAKVGVSFTLLDTADRPESWWTERRVELPKDIAASDVSGMAAASQKLTGVEYWKSPAGLAILIGGGVLALGLIAAGGRGYKAPAAATTTPTTP
jgi:hypothetical protein